MTQLINAISDPETTTVSDDVNFPQRVNVQGQKRYTVYLMLAELVRDLIVKAL